MFFEKYISKYIFKNKSDIEGGTKLKPPLGVFGYL